ncbi:MAG: WG repeat-containing protein [Bacilli bacterium]|nr:WG repeat-containing protein [Bacilli bacterium]
MDEKFLEYKKSKQYKKHILINVFLMLLLFIILGCLYYFYLMYNNEDEIVYDENKKYTYEIKENTLYLNSNEGIEQSYKCKEDCVIYTTSSNKQYYDKGKVLIKDGESIYLYNLLKNKKISGYYNRVDFILNKEGTSIELFKVNDSFGKQGIIDLDGNILVDMIYEELGKSLDEKFINYSLEKNYITAKLNSKWGMISLNNGKGLIDFQYEDIVITPYNKLVVKEGKLWYLVDDLNKKIIPKGYDFIFVHKDYLVVTENSQVFVLDLIGNVISNKLDIYYKVDPWATITLHGIQSYEENDIIYILVDVPVDIKAGTSKSEKYYYDLESKEIIKYE